MKLHRMLGALVLALGVTAPMTGSAQTSSDPASLAAMTQNYFHALYAANGGDLDGTTTKTFHVINQYGKTLSYDEFIRGVIGANTMEIPPVGTDVNIKSQNITATGATQTVQTTHWFGGAPNQDPMMGPATERDYVTHQLTWVKAPSGKWLLEEDHITTFTRT